MRRTLVPYVLAAILCACAKQAGDTAVDSPYDGQTSRQFSKSDLDGSKLPKQDIDILSEQSAGVRGVQGYNSISPWAAFKYLADELFENPQQAMLGWITFGNRNYFYPQQTQGAPPPPPGSTTTTTVPPYPYYNGCTHFKITMTETSGNFLQRFWVDDERQKWNWIRTGYSQVVLDYDVQAGDFGSLIFGIASNPSRKRSMRIDVTTSACGYYAMAGAPPPPPGAAYPPPAPTPGTANTTIMPPSYPTASATQHLSSELKGKNGRLTYSHLDIGANGGYLDERFLSNYYY